MPACFAENFGKKNPPSTLKNASVVAVTVPDINECTTVGVYNIVGKTVITKDGANQDRSFGPVTSIVLVPLPSTSSASSHTSSSTRPAPTRSLQSPSASRRDASRRPLPRLPGAPPPHDAVAEREAFKLGIIDAKGNILKKRRDLDRVAEREAFTLFDLMILNLKKALAVLPGGSTRVATYAAALWLLREFGEDASERQLLEAVRHYRRSQCHRSAR